MPTYSYRCEECGHEFERVQRISEDPIKECPNCSKPRAKRQIVQGNFILKGGGWYSDLYSGGSNKKSGSTSESSSSSSSSTASKSSESSTKSSSSDSGSSGSGGSGSAGGGSSAGGSSGGSGSSGGGSSATAAK